MNQRRILIWYWSATGGGGSSYAVNLARRLARRFGSGVVRLSLHANDPCIARALRHPEFETLAADVVTSRRHPLRTFASLGDSARVLASHAQECDAVIVPMNFASAAPLVVSIRQPIVYFAHDPAPHPGDYAALGQRLTQRILLSRAARVVALSGYGADELARLGIVKEKIIMTPLSAVFEPRVGVGRSEGPITLIFAGRMIAYKGLDLLAEALPRVSTQTGWRLTIAGDGPALDAGLRRRLEQANVDLRPGWMSESDLDDAIANSDILVAPYRSATQSGVVAQALASGRPAIVTPVGGLPAQIGEGAAGWVARLASAEALADVLAVAVKDANERALKARGACEIAERAWNDDHWAWLDAV